MIIVSLIKSEELLELIDKFVDEFKSYYNYENSIRRHFFTIDDFEFTVKKLVKKIESK